MNSIEIEDVISLRKAFNSVKERQRNVPDNFIERKKILKISRELCVGNDDILTKTVNKIRKNGINVHIAKNKQDVIDIIEKEIGQEEIIVKSKSNVTKELELTKYLEKKGLKVIETDIGDRILQILDAKPSHPTGPIAHLSAEKIAKGLSLYYNIHIRDNPEEIVKIVREDIISNITKANIGITGANAITAEEGSIIIVHNEGNVYETMRKKKHIIITSIDKIYYDIESAINMIKILSYNATGSIIPSFVEIISGVSKTADVEKKFIKGVHSPSDIILILIDNRRSEIIKNGYKDILMCIGCGNCLIHCPMYNTIGNEFAKDNYLGGKGLAYYHIYNHYNLSNNGKNRDVDNNKNYGEDKKLKLCLTCGKCKQNCPLELDMPSIINKIRSDGISSDIYNFLRSHMIWMYYQILLKCKENIG